MEAQENTTEIKPNTNQIREDLVNDVRKIESENQENPSQPSASVPVSKPFTCPERLLDIAQGFPVYFQEFILCQDLTKAQRKEVEDIFKASPEELKINRALMKCLIERVCEKIPALQSIICDELLFFLHWGHHLNERKGLLELRLELMAAKK